LLDWGSPLRQSSSLLELSNGALDFWGIESFATDSPGSEGHELVGIEEVEPDESEQAVVVVPFMLRTRAILRSARLRFTAFSKVDRAEAT
jgi:hypothetical protein